MGPKPMLRNWSVLLRQTCMPSNGENATTSSLDFTRFLKRRCYLNASHADRMRLVRGLGEGRRKRRCQPVKKSRVTARIDICIWSGFNAVYMMKLKNDSFCSEEAGGNGLS